MRTDLDHLPDSKRRELEYVVQLLFEEFREAQGDATSRKRRRGRIVKIILYGSHARGGWVDEPHTAKGYVSDFDLLVIVNERNLTDRATHWTRTEERMLEERRTGQLRTPVNFIVHSLQHVNDALAHGRFFFMDIVKEGIALYQVDDRPLATPRPKSPQDNLDLAKEYFEEWFPSGMVYLNTSGDLVRQGRPKEAAFLMHQAAERLYHCINLVLKFYTPHNHNLAFLREQAEGFDLRLVDVWPRTQRKERAMFEKLRDAYVKARYSKHYRISREELDWLGERVETLGRVVHEICTARIGDLEEKTKSPCV